MARPIRLASQSMAIVAGLTAAGGAVAASLVVTTTSLPVNTVVASLAVLALVVTTTSIVAWVLARHTTRPVRRTATALQTGSPEMGVRTPDAFGDLLDALAALRNRLSQSVETHREARREAEQTEAYETEFLTTVSHELRTPLNAILGFAQVLLDEIDGPLSTGQREDVEVILASGEMLRDLVDEVLDLAAMQSGRFTLTRQEVDPRPIAREVARLLGGQRGKKPVAIETDIDSSVPSVAADPRRLRQILTNLGTNALKFTDEGVVCFEITTDGADEVRLTVRDTGSGIAKSELATIFEEFTQVGDVRRKTQGTGLGLAICKRLVELHGGRIDVESVVGEGSAFHVFLSRWDPT